MRVAASTGAPSTIVTATTSGRPAVIVPVLSSTTVSTLRARWSASALRISTPMLAARPSPTMIAVGVASPRAHGQAMMSTVTAVTTPSVKAGSGPNAHHPANVSVAMPSTMGTKTEAMRSASAWIGALEVWASSTRRMIRESAESAPTAVARSRRRPVAFIVAPNTSSPPRFVTGKDSPVSIDSSTALSPSRTTPSTGICSPGRTTTVSPACTARTGISYSSPSSRTRASCGRRAMRARTAAEVRPLARASSQRPSRTRPMIAADAS